MLVWNGSFVGCCVLFKHMWFKIRRKCIKGCWEGENVVEDLAKSEDHESQGFVECWKMEVVIHWCKIDGNMCADLLEFIEQEIAVKMKPKTSQTSTPTFSRFPTTCLGIDHRICLIHRNCCHQLQPPLSRHARQGPGWW